MNTNKISRRAKVIMEYFINSTITTVTNILKHEGKGVI